MCSRTISLPLAILVTFVTAVPLLAQQSDDAPIVMTISAATTPTIRTEHRLLPADDQLRDGNAAVVMLRMIWEQQNYMQRVVPQLDQMMDLPYDDPSIPRIIAFDHFERALRRAAYIRDAQWNYPFGEEPHASILLPDVQGLRVFAGRGMTLWVGSKIAACDLQAAREGMLVQIACARHMARTPIMVNQLVASVIALSALDRAEIFIQQQESPNLYWALAMLPETLGDVQRCLEWEANVVQNSIPSLTKPYPAVGDDAWLKISDEFSEHMVMMMGGGLPATEAALLLVKMDAIARADLVVWSLFSENDLSLMIPQEAITRWIFHQSDIIHSQLQTAFTLPAPQAFGELEQLEESIARLMERTGAPAAPFNENPVGLYLSMHQFGRRVKMLQVVEAIRDEMTRNDGLLPKSLQQIRSLHVPNDPLTGKPFDYKVVDGTGYLNTPRIPRIDQEKDKAANRQYVIKTRVQ